MKKLILITITLAIFMLGFIFWCKPKKKIVRQVPVIQIDKVDSLENLVKIN